MIDDSLAYDVLSASLSNGADFAEIYLENSRKKSLTLINGNAEYATSGIDFGLGLRIFVGDKVLYSYTSDIGRDNLLKFAKNSALAIKGDKNTVPEKFERIDYTKNNSHNVKIIPSSISQKQTAEMLKAASNAAFSYNELITQTSVSYSAKEKELCIKS